MLLYCVVLTSEGGKVMYALSFVMFTYVVTCLAVMKCGREHGHVWSEGGQQRESMAEQ